MLRIERAVSPAGRALLEELAGTRSRPDLEGLREAGVLDPEGDLESATGPISEVVAFDEFMNRVVVATVQSGGGRTLPDDSRSDLYPIELTRDSIRPGTVFVDPYGHLLVVTQWIDQTATSPGMRVSSLSQNSQFGVTRPRWTMA